MHKSVISRINRILWVVLLLSLPITSFPLLQQLFGGTSVAPLAIVPLIILVIIKILPEIIAEKKLPLEFMPLLMFFGVALIATFAANFIDIPSFREVPISKNSLEGVLTLITGMAFFLAPIYLIKSEAQLRGTLIAIYIAAVVIIFFSLLQGISLLVSKSYPGFLRSIQELISISGKLYRRRVTGLAFEPSWLAHQLNLLFIPFFLSMTVTGHSIFRSKLFKKFNYENLFLVLSLCTLVMSFSRIGWLSAILLLGYVLFRLVAKRVDRTRYTGFVNTLIKILIFIGILLLLGGIILIVGWILTKVDPRMEKLFDVERYREFGFLGWAGQLGIAERMILWISAYKVYLLYPLLGVGLGGAGYFFQNTLPDFGFRLPETNTVFIIDTFVPNAKNLWVRLLSETGIIGFIFFVVWIYGVIKNCCVLEKSDNNEYRSIGLFGKLVGLALVVEGFSMDTFGLPYIWLSFGIVVAVFRLKALSQKI